MASSSSSSPSLDGLQLGPPVAFTNTTSGSDTVPVLVTTDHTATSPPTTTTAPGPPVSTTDSFSASTHSPSSSGDSSRSSDMPTLTSIVVPTSSSSEIHDETDTISALPVRMSAAQGSTSNANLASPTGSTRDRSPSVASSTISVDDVQGDGSVPAQRQKEFEKYFAARLSGLTSESSASLASTASAPAALTASGSNLTTGSDDYLTVLSTRAADLQAKVLVHGRLYLTKHHLCFRSNILGIKTVNVHPISSLVEVRNGTTAKFIQNAVYIKEEGKEKVGYGTLSDRDAFLEILTSCWRAKAPEAYDAYMSTIHDGPEDEVTADPGALADDSEVEPGDKSSSSSPSSEIKHTKDSGKRYAELAIDTKFPVTPEQLFKLLYHTKEYTMEFMEKNQKLKEVQVSEWQAKKRTLSYIMSITNPIGPNETHSTSVEVEEVADADKAYEIASETKNPDLPSGKNFSIKTRTCITHTDVGGKPGCRFVATTQVDWTASSMLKSKITTASIAGQKEYHQKLAKKIRQWIKSHPADFGQVAGDGADVGEGEDDGAEQYGEDVKDEMATRDSASGGKGWEDHASEILGNPVMSAITAVALALLLLELYHLFFGRGSRGTASIQHHVELLHAKKILSSEPMARLEQLERLLGLDRTSLTATAAKVAKVTSAKAVKGVRA